MKKVVCKWKLKIQKNGIFKEEDDEVEEESGARCFKERGVVRMTSVVKWKQN